MKNTRTILQITAPKQTRKHRTTALLKPIAAALLLGWAHASAWAALDVKIQANPKPAMPGEVADVKLTVTNSDGFSRSGVVIKMEYPLGLAALAESLITGGGDCNYVIGAHYNCDATEILTWNLGTLPAGKGVTVTLPPSVAAGTLPGTVIEFAAEASDSSGAKVNANETVEVVNSRVLQLGLTEVTQEPVQPGSTLAYQLSFGHTASSAVATNAVLELPVPAGMNFVSASDGGTLVAGKVQWSLGTLQPGQVGKRQVTFTVDPLDSLETGVTRKLEASLRDASGKLVRADDTTRIEAEAPLH